jgi:hypothetical protein
MIPFGITCASNMTDPQTVLDSELQEFVDVKKKYEVSMYDRRKGRAEKS